MPTIDQKVHKEPGKPRTVSSTATFFPGDEEILNNGEQMVGIPAHWDSNHGFVYPDPEAPGQFMRAYIKSYDRDDSNPAERKRHMVIEEIV